MKKLIHKIKLLKASLNGALDGFELDNTCDVIEKSTVIEMIKELIMLVDDLESEASKPQTLMVGQKVMYQGKPVTINSLIDNETVSILNPDFIQYHTPLTISVKISEIKTSW